MVCVLISSERILYLGAEAHLLILDLLPGYLFTALSTFTWVCWIRPDNIIINQLFGYEYGLGMSLITFDWSQIAYIGSP